MTLRPLTDCEREILRKILTSVPFPQADRLAAQIPSTRAVEGGIPTFIDLEVVEDVEPAECADGPLRLAGAVESDTGEYQGQILVWVEGGKLAGLDFGWVTDEVPRGLPNPSRVKVELRPTSGSR
jgi:hypothetical protein